MFGIVALGVVALGVVALGVIGVGVGAGRIELTSTNSKLNWINYGGFVLRVVKCRAD
jgi:hypothetical protein